jgi:hypothetical protein
MNEEDLNRLIDKYYRGESTEEEENALRDHFKKDDIPPGYEAEKVIFGYYALAGELPEPSENFKEMIMSAIEAYNPKTTSRKSGKYILRYLSAAAALLIFAGSWFFFVHRAEPEDTYSDPVIAYAETMKILRDVSSRLNHGTQALEPISKINEMTTRSFKSIKNSTGIIEKSIRNLDNFQKAIEIHEVPMKKSINK